MRLPLIERGKRAFIGGRTGSGKTTGAAWLLSRSPGKWIILNPKHDETLAGLGPSVDLDVSESLAVLKEHPGKAVVINPDTFDQGELDAYILELSESCKNVGLLVDELLYLSKGNGQAGPGLLGWLTRGRSRGQSFAGTTQRPANVSQYVYSEADYFALFDLKLDKDWSRIKDFTGRDLQRDRKKHHWCWYDVGEDRSTEFGPVPYSNIQKRFS